MLPLITSFTLHIQMCPVALKCPYAEKKTKQNAKLRGSYNCHLYYNKSQGFCSEIQTSELDSKALGELKTKRKCLGVIYCLVILGCSCLFFFKVY